MATTEAQRNTEKFGLWPNKHNTLCFSVPLWFIHRNLSYVIPFMHEGFAFKTLPER